MKPITLLPAFFLILVFVSSAVLAEPDEQQRVKKPVEGAVPGQFAIKIRDGSNLLGAPLRKTISLTTVAAGNVEVRWSLVEQLSMSDDRESVVVLFRNQDRLTGILNDATIEFATLIGKVKIPAAAVVQIRSCGSAVAGKGSARNIALGKQVSGRDGASHGKGLAVHLTDGNRTTFTKPPSNRCDYIIDLRKSYDGTTHDHSFRIDKLVVHWGEFGTRFLGISKGDGKWASGSWPGSFVTQYQIEYQTAADPSGKWKMLHRFDGQPADESSETVQAVVAPSKVQGAGGDVTTTITGIEVSNVIALRIRTSGGHWNGIYELEAYGYREP